MATKQLKNAIQHKLTVAPLAGDTTLTWDSVAGWPTTGDFIIRLDDVAGTKTEFVLCTAVNVGLLQTTVTRGQESTSGTAFSINDLGTNDLTAQMMIDAFVRLDTALSQTLTGPLVIPTALGGSAAATSYGSVPLKASETLLGIAAATITYSSIPATFRHAKVDWYARGDNASGIVDFSMKFNSSAVGYDHLQVYNSSATAVTAIETLAATSGKLGTMPANTATANYFGAGEVRIKNYAGTVGNKFYEAKGGLAQSDVTTQQFNISVTGKWRTTATAINRIDISPAAGNFVANSLFTFWLEP